MTKNLNLFNTLSKKKEQFIPINSNKVGMYVCGPINKTPSKGF